MLATQASVKWIKAHEWFFAEAANGLRGQEEFIEQKLSQSCGLYSNDSLILRAGLLWQSKQL